MILKDDSSEQKLRGAYYTPKKLADTIVKILSPKMNSNILEPSCGDGVFLDALQCTKILDNFDKVTAIEIDEDEATKVKRKFERHCNVEVNSEDFFLFYQKVLGKRRYDLILGNPPYIRYQYLTDLQR
ncbi:MAG: 23S rRNA (adenine(2030)-N(6))-methyltransferase RlmJ [Succinivibrio sp.]|nr:23S rRNA (adenine(2030)-N(6))-methyltransferase RlmJ [Succinivibrio sp.]